MSSWNTYSARLCADGCSDDPHRASQLDHIQRNMLRKITSSLSFKTTIVNGVNTSLAVIDTTEFDTKKIFAMPGSDLMHGAIVEWSNAIWLITEVNASKEFCAEGKMRRCNHLLKWIDGNGVLISRWCVVEDGTKYLIGERTSDIMAIGDARVAVTIGKDSDTSKLSRGRRFLIDDDESDDILAYEITKPNKLFNVYNGAGVFRFILKEVNVTDNDNTELRIADYYSWKPAEVCYIPDIQDGRDIEDVVSDAISEAESREQRVLESGVWL